MKDRLDEKKLEDVSGGVPHGMVICGECEGSGVRDGALCPSCGGTGFINNRPLNANKAVKPADL